MAFSNRFNGFRRRPTAVETAGGSHRECVSTWLKPGENEKVSLLVLARWDAEITGYSRRSELSTDSDKEILFLLLVRVAHTLKFLRNARFDRIGTTDFSVRRTLIG